MKFLTKKTTIEPAEYVQLLSRFSGEEDFINFLMNKNIAHPEDEACLKIAEEEYGFDYFLGRSKNSDEDIKKVAKAYKDRIPEKFLPIAVTNEIDFICVGEDSRFYLWRRGVNDLYFDEKSKNKYKKQDKNLFFLAENFNTLLGLISSCEIGQDEEFIDDYENPNTPFEDEDIDDDFKHPELFFKQAKNDVDIQLKKLALSKKGQDLLLLFKNKKLM